MNTEDKPELIVFYGSLMQGLGAQDEARVSELLRYQSPCRIAGRLYDLGEFPGLVLEEGTVSAELYEILDAEVIESLDRYEGFNPASPKDSFYIRTRIPLLDHKAQASVYVYNQPIEGLTVVDSGCWRSYCKHFKPHLID